MHNHYVTLQKKKSTLATVWKKGLHRYEKNKVGEPVTLVQSNRHQIFSTVLDNHIQRYKPKKIVLRPQQLRKKDSKPNVILSEHRVLKSGKEHLVAIVGTAQLWNSPVGALAFPSLLSSVSCSLNLLAAAISARLAAFICCICERRGELRTPDSRLLTGPTISTLLALHLKHNKK
jgi:hypothetical protein